MEKEQEQKSKPKHVEELEYFPFKSFDELKKRVNEGVANLGVDRSAALQWIQNGIYSTSWQRAFALFLGSLTFIVPIGLIIYIVVTQTWLLLLALPLLLIGFFIFHPGQAMLLGPIRSGLILLTFGGLIWGFLNGIGWLTALTLSLVILWYAQRTIYRKAVDGLLRAAIQHEDLLCILWSGNALNIRMYNGDSYWSKWKTEGGKSTHYDTGNTYNE
ncbi:MAG: hypothetical protein ABIJ28_03580 [Patescibacteria group bacterium]